MVTRWSASQILMIKMKGGTAVCVWGEEERGKNAALWCTFIKTAVKI